MSLRRGQCLCGACRFEVEMTPDDLRARACHCQDCRRWSGGAVYVVGPLKGVRWNHDAPIELLVSSSWAERGFCGLCASGLYWSSRKQPDGAEEAVALMVGLFDDYADFELASEIFVDERLPLIPAHATALQRTRAEVIDRYQDGTAYDGKPTEDA